MHKCSHLLDSNIMCILDSYIFEKFGRKRIRQILIVLFYYTKALYHRTENVTIYVQ